MTWRVFAHLASGRAPGYPTGWIGVRQLAVQRVWGWICLGSAAPRGQASNAPASFGRICAWPFLVIACSVLKTGHLGNGRPFHFMPFRAASKGKIKLPNDCPMLAKYLKSLESQND